MCNLAPTSGLTLFNLISLYFLLIVGLCETLTNQSKLRLLFYFPITLGEAKGERQSRF